jgi:sugar O-acyltransferase (sialic acid O-acetyltransferase NeuD family)|tara:strand:+ start:554 stop:1240 length:687 start_codon:yes stop_codon:yes gene_type:complete
MKKPLVIFGTAEIASLAKFYFTHDSDYDVVAFTADDQYVGSDTYEGLPVVPFSEVTKKYPPETFEMHVALSYMKLNQLREEKYHQAKAEGYTLANYISTKATTWPDLSVGDNCFILEDQTIQPTVKIGNNVMLWSGNHIGHGTHIGDHTYFASHIVVSGHCKIGQRCFFGVNATFKDFLTIGDDVFVAMDASVTKDLPNGSVALGAQSTIFEAEDRRAQKIKKSYFKL